MKNYPWYEIVEGKDQLLQGDFVNSCPIIVPSIKIEYEILKDIDTDVIQYDVVIMSQSCDIFQQKLDIVLVCPVCRLAELEHKDPSLESKKVKEDIRRGYLPGYHLLNKSDVVGLSDYILVDFRNVYGVPLNFLIELVKSRGDRLRLLPPYREHLSQAFARFFMRVGLPIDIPSFI